MGSTAFCAATAGWIDAKHLWGERTELYRAAKRYERADPVADAKRAIAAGDMRLLPAVGIGGFFPGLPDADYAANRMRFGEKEPVYAGCVVASKEESQFRNAAYEYAVKYNQAVVEHATR